MRFPRSVALAAAVVLVLGLGFGLNGGLVRVAAAATPVRTPTPAVPADVAAYGATVGEQAEALADGLLQIGVLMQDPKLNDYVWQIDLASQFVEIQTAHKTLSALRPPAAMADIHRQILSGSQDCHDSTVLATSGIDNLDVDDLESAADLMISCGEKMAAAQGMIESYIAALPPPAVATPKATARATLTLTLSSGAAIQNSNLREGPGTTYAVVGSLKAGDRVNIVEKNAAGDWYKLDNGKWVAAFLITLDAAPARAATATPKATASAARTPTPTAAPVCDCSTNLYNCTDFSTQAEAQACFDYCMDVQSFDVHGLDPDNDGDTCELLPP